MIDEIVKKPLNTIDKKAGVTEIKTRMLQWC